MPKLPCLILLALVLALPAPAQKHYDPGASDTEIKVGNLMPYSGQFADSGVLGKAEAAYFRMVNDHGGIRGRKVNFISLDSGAGPQAALELVKQLVEQDQVLLVAGPWGNAVNKAVRPYLNDHHVPQLFVASSEATFDDPEHFPWTMGFAPSKRTEALAYGKYLVENRPDARVAVLTTDDEEGTEFRNGLVEGLGARAAAMIVQEGRFRSSEPDAIDGLVAQFQKAGADVFMNLTYGRTAIRGIVKAYDLGWKPMQFIPNGSNYVVTSPDLGDPKKAYGLVSNARSKGWMAQASFHGRGVKLDPAVGAFLDFMHMYLRDADLHEVQYVFAYEVAQTVEAVLKACGDDLTRANVMAQATHLDLELGMLAPTIRVRTSPTDYRPIKDLYFVRYDGKGWVALGTGLAP